MMFVDGIIYAILAWYLAEILPTEYGTRKHPLFIFDYRFWIGGVLCASPGRGKEKPSEAEMESLLETRNDSETDDGGIERLDSSDKGKISVFVLGMRKRYSDGKLAVKNLSLTMLEGQITCLLGHNGESL
jgi:ATP-binding cassette subfamily A (ABC1) protein 3